MARHIFYTNPHGGAEVHFHGTKRSATAAAHKFFRRMKNVEMGFYDSKGTFHPIRASRDYSGRRAGEGRRVKHRKGKKGRRR